MRTIDADLLKRMQLPQGTGHWAWCYEIIVDEDIDAEERTVVQLTSWGDAIALTVPVDGTPTELTFTPYPITHDAIKSDSEGTVQAWQIQLADTQRMLGKLVEKGKGYRGRRVRLFAVNVEVADLGPAATVTGWCTSATLAQTREASSLVLTCSMGANLHDRDLPHQTVQPYRCRHLRYGQGRCGMHITAATPSPLLTCPRTWAACIDRRDWMASVGLPSGRLPARIGSFPGVPAEQRR